MPIAKKSDDKSVILTFTLLTTHKYTNDYLKYTKVASPYLANFCYLLPYTTQIHKVEISVRL